jgi:hypothetical protein
MRGLAPRRRPGVGDVEVAVHASALPREPAEVSVWLGEIVAA